MWHVYLLLCKDKSIYPVRTPPTPARLAEAKAKRVGGNYGDKSIGVHAPTGRSRSARSNGVYTGITNNLEKRLLRHRQGKGGRYTRSHKVVKLLYAEQWKTKSEALKREAQIKSWPREKKVRLVRLGKF